MKIEMRREVSKGGGEKTQQYRITQWVSENCVREIVPLSPLSLSLPSYVGSWSRVLILPSIACESLNRQLINASIALAVLISGDVMASRTRHP